MSVHGHCEYYVEKDDICLCYFMLTNCAFDVSKKSKKCLDEVIYDD